MTSPVALDDGELQSRILATYSCPACMSGQSWEWSGALLQSEGLSGLRVPPLYSCPGPALQSSNDHVCTFWSCVWSMLEVVTEPASSFKCSCPPLGVWLPCSLSGTQGVIISASRPQ